MPESSMWGLICSLILLAIGSTLKAVEISHSLKSANEEIARLRKQIEMIEEEKNKLALEASNTNLISAGFHNNSLKFNETTGTWVEEDSGLRYCAKCKPQTLSPLKKKDTGWECPMCNKFYSDPEKPRPSRLANSARFGTGL